MNVLSHEILEFLYYHCLSLIHEYIDYFEKELIMKLLLFQFELVYFIKFALIFYFKFILDQFLCNPLDP